MNTFTSSSHFTEVVHDPLSFLPMLPSSFFPTSWSMSFARSSVFSFLQSALRVGHLEITDSQGVHRFGTYERGRNTVRMTVNNDLFYVRVLASADIGLSESYMMSDIDVVDLKGMMNLWLDNYDEMTGLDSTLSSLSAMVSGLYNAFLGQSPSRARLNVMDAYDQSNDLFKGFLSDEMMYSCALWSDEEGGFRGDFLPTARPSDLETAQLRKIRHVLTMARVKPGMKVLEFGSGWGAMAIEAARSFGAEVDTLTLSIEQKTLAEDRVREAGLQGRIRVHLMDYRDMPADWAGRFDAFVSVEMLEHVGTQHYETYFKLVDWALKDKNATAVVTSTTFPEARYRTYQPEDFMRRYMWPNSALPCVTALVTATTKASQNRFSVQSVENHGAHYPRTLREWSRRLEANVTADTMAKRYPGLRDPAAFETFRRKWGYLFAYAGAGFAKGYISCHMLTFYKNGMPAPCD
ncbi:Mycolic acid cyclopropane synthetase-domain-containing protein [Thelephora terrestris]|uniref:Mycolic acid cyclopropane synthetase-domain-containing protein n=1 Tax=Thelephora terrestris TaxID=56493 RepID=A0A9P6HBK0_9AGAM|nr:Mycolic acid cyclopropane synthetase-domain-containing protein [Thelephora terrestris]